MVELDFNIESDVDFTFFHKLKLDTPLSNIAMAVQRDIQRNLRQSRTAKGPYMKKLAKKTINEKAKLNVATPSKPLMRFRNMYKNVRVHKVSHNFWQVDFATSESNDKAYYHNVAGASKAKVKRPFFGVSKKRELWAMNYLQSWLRNKLKAGRYKQYGTVLK